jgi:hypothetical protein
MLDTAAIIVLVLICTYAYVTTGSYGSRKGDATDIAKPKRTSDIVGRMVLSEKASDTE